MGRTIKMLVWSAVFFLPILSAQWDSPKDSSCEAGWLDATWVDMGCLLFYSGSAMTWKKPTIIVKSRKMQNLLKLQQKTSSISLLWSSTSLMTTRRVGTGGLLALTLDVRETGLGWEVFLQ